MVSCNDMKCESFNWTTSPAVFRHFHIRRWTEQAKSNGELPTISPVGRSYCAKGKEDSETL